MSCMCGDYCCPSCGPAQGNSKCELCGQWASEGCIHINSRTGNYKKKYLKAVEEAARKEDAMLEELAELWNEDAMYRYERRRL